MADVTVIGRGANVVGTVSGAVDLEIHGRVEGEVTVEGDVTVEADGLVAAGIAGRRVVVRGAVKGDVTAEEAIRLEEGARVLGDLRAPRVAVTHGALVRGYVQTSDAGADSRSRAQTTNAPAARRAPPAPPARVAAVRPSGASDQANAGANKAHVPSLLAGGGGPKGPPPPVVPVLRKGVKGTLKKRAG